MLKPPTPAELGDLSDMPRDPRWVVLSNGSIRHVNHPGGVGIVIPPGPDQEAHRLQVQWYSLFYKAVLLMQANKKALDYTPKLRQEVLL